MKTVLIVEDEQGLREGLCKALESIPVRTVSAAGLKEARKHLAESEIDCVLLDIRLKDGRRFSHLQPDRKGDPELPLSDDDLEGKLLELATPSIGEPAARALIGRIWALHEQPNLP